MELVEREEFLEVLRMQFKNIEAGEGQCVFVSGEAGIGKTSLVKAFCKEYQEKCTIYRGACDALFTPRPLGPLYDIIWQVNSSLWPHNHTMEERSELFASFVRELADQQKNIIILFEDIHWADEATLDFIRFFARRISLLPCLFMLTYRDDESSFDTSIRSIIGQLSPDNLTRIHLTPLSRNAVTEMAAGKGYNGGDVYAISAGNPFYVNEILASYSPGIPENIKDSILTVYDRQEEGTKHAWQICSVIPEGLEISRFAKIKATWGEGMDHCFALKIIIVKNDRVVFKHELYRRTIEESLSPFKRIALNKMMLDLFLPSFEAQGEIERIVQYAKNSNENALVVKYAPIAARQAASLGAHIEASRLFLAAIQYSEGNDEDQLLGLYEEYAYECYLTNQPKEAIIYATKSLKLWEDRDDLEKTANCLCFLSRLWWVDDNLKNAENSAREAIDLLENQVSSIAKARAYSLMSQLKMLSDLPDECIYWGEKAITLAKQLPDNAILSYALGNVGSVRIRIPSSEQEGHALLRESLKIALENGNQDYAGMAYTNLGYNGIIVKNYALTNEALDIGIPYCDENNLDLWRLYLLTIKAKLYLEIGDWTKAYNIAEQLAQDGKAAKLISIYALTTLANIDMRRGNNEQVLSRLNEATEKAFDTTEPQRIIQALTAFLEYEWITGTHLINEEILESTIEMTAERGNIYGNSEFAFWLQKSRGQSIVLKETYRGYDIGDPAKAKKAAKLWKKIGCPFNEAMSLFMGTEDDKREAITIVKSLGADAVYQKMKMEMRAVGIKKIPRGIRESTRTNPAQLTNRELDVLQLLQKGNQNKEIAAMLYISSKTADHHISSILYKLEVNSRIKAVSEAVRLGILK